METLLLFTTLLTPFTGPAPDPHVADRSEPIREALEKQLNKKAVEITFDDLAKVTELRLPHIHPQAKAFKDADFAGLTNLKTLHMYSLFHNKGGPEATIAISGKVFKDLSKLEELRITQDQLGQLPDDVFAGLTSLGVLDLSYITLNRLPSSLLTLPKIETVYYEGRGMSQEDFATLKNNLGDKLKGNRPTSPR
jgi:Leucine rich repeat